MRFYIRINGALKEVWPMTKPSVECTTVKVRVISTLAIMRIQATELIIDY